MIREFYILLSILLLSIGGIASHYILYDTSSIDSDLIAISSLSRVSSPSLSVRYLEARVLAIDSVTNPSYPQMETIDRMDFIYAK